jgi:hypothetical protein
VHTAVSQFCAEVWRRVVVAVVAASGFCFGLDYLLVMVWSLDYLISSCLVRYPMFGYLA